jgi:hypothetical protein
LLQEKEAETTKLEGKRRGETHRPEPLHSLNQYNSEHEREMSMKNPIE